MRLRAHQAQSASAARKSACCEVGYLAEGELQDDPPSHQFGAQQPRRQYAAVRRTQCDSTDGSSQLRGMPSCTRLGCSKLARRGWAACLRHGMGMLSVSTGCWVATMMPLALSQ